MGDIDVNTGFAWPIAVVAMALFTQGCGGDGATLPSAHAPSCAGGEQSSDGVCVAAGLPDLACNPAEREDNGECIPAGVPPDGCGEGFVHDGDGSCEPILPAEPCAPGLMAVPGETACHEVAPCASGRWGDIPVETNTEYVDASYTGMDSDGSALKPWTTIQAAVDVAAPNAIVAIAEGSYVEDVSVTNDSVRLWGVCPALVEIAGTGAEIATVTVYGGAAGSEVHNLALGGDAVGFTTPGALDVLLEHVWIRANTEWGIDVEGAFGPASVTLRASLVEETHAIGVFAQDAELTIESSVVRATVPDELGRAYGVAVKSDLGEMGSTTLRRSVIERNRHHGVIVLGAEAALDASVVRTTQPNFDGTHGLGIGAYRSPETGEPSTLWLAASLIEKNYQVGVGVVGSEATIETTVVRDTQAQGHSSYGEGFGVGIMTDPPTTMPSTAVLRDSMVARNQFAGVLVVGADSTVESSVIRDTLPETENLGGFGVVVLVDPITGNRSTFHMGASLIDHNQESGVLVEASDATVETSIVRGTLPNASGLLGRGIAVQADPITVADSTLALHSSLVEQNHEAGLYVSGSRATVEASVIRETAPNAQGRGGRGVAVEAHATTGAPSALVLRTSFVQHNHEAGVAVLGSEGTVDACIVRDTLANPQGAFGHGIAVVSSFDDMAVTIGASRIEQSALAALAAWGARATLGGSVLSCQAHDLNSERYDGNPAELEDVGGNACGCPDPIASCQQLSVGLAAPPPLGAVAVL